MRISKKILAIALSILMAVSMMPFTAYAATGVADGAELKAAIAAAQNGDVIEFTADVTEYPATSGALVIPVDGKNITIDLKGHTQYFRVSGETAVTYATDLFVLKNGAKLTIVDSEGGGAFYATYGANSAAYMFNVTDSSELVIDGGQFVMDAANYGGVIVYQNDATASTTINGGEFTANTGAKARRDYLINNTRGEVEINGGEFTTARTFDYVISEGNTTDTKLTINDGEFNGTMSLDVTNADTTINGGTYLDNAGEANTAVSAYLPADKVIDENGQIADVDATTVARIGSQEFTSLADAFASVSSGSATIELVKDAVVDNTIVVNNGVKYTINMNGNTISSTKRVFEVRNGSVATKGTGTIETTATSAVAVYGSADSSVTSTYSTFNLGKDTTIDAPNGYGAMIGATSGAAYGAQVTINGTVDSKYGLYVNGNVAQTAASNAARFNVYGSVSASNADAAIYAAGYANWFIGTATTPATLTAGSGIYAKSGNITVTNAIINAIGDKVDYAYNSNGCGATGDAIVIDSCGYPGSVPTVTVKAGTITSANGEAVASYAKQDDPRYPDAEYPRVDEVIPATSTAVFSSDVSELAEDGYITVYDTTAGGYIIAEDETPEFNNPASLTLRDNIAVNYYLEATDLEATDVVNFTYNHNSDVNYEVNNVADSASVSELTDLVVIGSKNYYRLSFEAAPAQLSEEFTVEVVRGGTTIYSETTSMAEIAKAGKEQFASSDPAQSALFAAVLDYATAGQKAFGYADRASEGTYDGYYNDVANTTVEGSISQNNSSALSIIGATIVSVSKTKVRFYYTGDATSASVSVADAYGDGTYTATLGSNDKGNYVEISGIESANLDNTFTLTINDSVGSYQINASAFAIAKMLSVSSANDAEKELGKTLFNYGNAAQAFFVG